MRTKDTLETIDPAILDQANGGQARRAPTQRWQTAQGRAEIGDEFAECMTSAHRAPANKLWDRLWNGDNADTRTPRDCIDEYRKQMGVPR